jgi:hypothetical protein
MRQLVSPDGCRIVGTAEIIFGVALILGADEPGEGRARFTLHYQGGTEVDWDSQTTRTEQRERLFVDEDGMTWRESQVRFEPDEEPDT